jgi:TolB protein
VPLLLLTSLGLGCGSGGSEPSEEPALHDRLVFEMLGQLGAMAPDGSQRQILPTGDDLDMILDPAVSPDGKRVVFMGHRSEQWDLYVMNVDGSARRQVTNDAGQENGPSWSPDGDSLIFTWTPEPPETPVALTVMAADGTGRRELVPWGAGGRWSPDGRRVMFYGFGPLPAGIYVTDPAGDEVSRLDQGCGQDCTDAGSRWSPDGQFITFVRSLPGGTPTLGIMRADGSDARLLLPTLYTFGGIWSPDGRQVALNRFDGAEEAYSTYILTVATGDTVRIPSTFEFVSDWTR